MKHRHTKNRWLVTRSIVAAFIAAAPVASFSCAAQPEDDEKVASVRQRLESNATTRVSVLLVQQSTAQALAAAQAEIEAALGGTGARVLRKFKTTPSMSIELASPNDLDILTNHPQVERLELSMKGEALLEDSRELVGANASFYSGYSGAGRLIAVVDSGWDSDHPDLAGAVIAEACFCNYEGTPCCPNGQATQFGPGSAEDDQGHGTHVSGIITSDGVDSAPRGVAPDVQLIMVKGLNADNFGEVPDWVAALEWIHDNHPNVDAVNLSLGGEGRFEANCEQVAQPPVDTVNMANAIAALTNLGIVTVAATGNDSLKQEIAMPACIEEVVAVGATAKDNTVASFSNTNAGLDIMATGAGVWSTYYAGNSVPLDGTSMATPHVSAAVALLKEHNPALAPQATVECLLASNTFITDDMYTPENPYDDVTRPLLDIPEALATCGAELCSTSNYEAEQMVHSTGGLVTTVPGGAFESAWNIWTNGNISTTHTFQAKPTRISVNARGEEAYGVWPHMVVSVNGSPIGNVTVDTEWYSEYTFDFLPSAGPQQIRVSFDNDAYAPPDNDRNLVVDKVTVGCAIGQGGCEGICDPTVISWSENGNYQGSNLGTGARCFETTKPISGGICGGLVGGRTLRVNGVQMPCNSSNWSSVPAQPLGSSCVQVSAGNQSWAWFALW